MGIILVGLITIVVIVVGAVIFMVLVLVVVGGCCDGGNELRKLFRYRKAPASSRNDIRSRNLTCSLYKISNRLKSDLAVSVAFSVSHPY